MSNKMKGFSLAELLISLLVISIILSAAIPTLTKKSTGSEQIWRWSSSNNSAYFGTGALQSAIIGNDVVPDVSLSNTFTNVGGLESITTGNIKYTNSGDKLILLKQSSADNANSHLMNSHISFYTLANSSSASNNDVIYTGRLALEKHNMALGIGTLQSMNNTATTYSADAFLGRNTALGHYTLLSNVLGQYNTAVGETALSNSKYAYHNTAVGYKAGVYLDKDSTSVSETNNAGRNTIVGSEALAKGTTAKSNTAIGFQSLGTLISGTDGTAVGARALAKATGTGNTALGSGACGEIATGKFNICLGMSSGNYFDNATVANSVTTFKSNESLANSSNNMLFIGNMPNDTTSTNAKISPAPLIYGRMQYDTTNSKLRKVGFNTSLFGINSFDGAVPMFEMRTYAGADGATNGGEFKGSMNLTTYKHGTSESHAIMYGDTNSVYFTANNDGTSSSTTYKNIYLNNDQLRFNFSGSGTSRVLNVGSAANTIGLFNNRITITNDTNTPKLVFGSGGNIRIQNHSNNAYLELASNASMLASSSTVDITSSLTTIKTPLQVNGNDTLFNNTVRFTQLKQVGTGTDNLYNAMHDIYTNITNIRNEIRSYISDERLKNIQGDNTAGLKEINALEVKNYTYKDDKENTPQVGVIAQQLQKVFPNSVIKDDKGYLRIKTQEIFYAMVNSIKELCAQIQDLTAKIVGLDKRLTELEKENALLKQQNAEFEKRLERLEKKIK